MIEPDGNFVRQVGQAASRQVLGEVDCDEGHSVQVTETSLMIRDDAVPTLDITYASDGVSRHLYWPLDDVDDFIGETVAVSAEYLVSMIRIEIMERVGTGEF
ncbi:MAG: hypothetical protein ACRCYU_17325 [Nocardioides sp.]